MAKVVCRRTRFRKNNYPIREVYLSQNFHTTLHIVRQLFILSLVVSMLWVFTLKKRGKIVTKAIKSIKGFENRTTTLSLISHFY